MAACVVFESMYGRTHEIATAVGDGLRAHGDVTVVNVADADPELVAGVGVLVVGGPTHVHGMSRTSTRNAAMETAAKNDDLQAEPDGDGLGLREWFKQLPPADGQLGAAFDTRLNKPIAITGSAAKVIGKQLRKHRYSLLTEPESYFVESSEGPLEAGEIERARRWGSELGALITTELRAG